jgi:hypothetical protein
MVLTTADHRARVEEGVSKMRSVNDSITSSSGPFVLVSNADAQIMKSFWYNVWCIICGELFLIYLAKKILRVSLENHLNGIKHARALQDVAAKTAPSA